MRGFMRSASVQMKQYEEGKVELTNNLSQTKSVIDTLNNDTAKIQSDIDEKAQALQDIEDKISVAFTNSDQTNSFKLQMSLAFTALVSLVIAGFFAVALYDEKVRASIFSNESGIQFITLFSLVIAIILFGIVNVLEGRELAALLGGLSGYILGRGTGAGGAPPASAVARVPAPAASPAAAPAPA